MKYNIDLDNILSQLSTGNKNDINKTKSFQSLLLKQNSSKINLRTDSIQKKSIFNKSIVPKLGLDEDNPYKVIFDYQAIGSENIS